MRAEHYAQALWELESAGKADKNILANFTGTVARNGHAHLFPKIVRSFEHIAEKARKHETIEVVASEELGENDVATLLKSEPYKQVLTAKHKHVVRKIDDNLIGGALVRISGKRIDGSYKRALVDLYQSIIF